MKLIPPVILEPKSAAEEQIFKLLQQISFSHHDVALHSLNVLMAVRLHVCPAAIDCVQSGEDESAAPVFQAT